MYLLIAYFSSCLAIFLIFFTNVIINARGIFHLYFCWFQVFFLVTWTINLMHNEFLGENVNSRRRGPWGRCVGNMPWPTYFFEMEGLSPTFASKDAYDFFISWFNKDLIKIIHQNTWRHHTTLTHLTTMISRDLIMGIISQHHVCSPDNNVCYT
jgi:hypothetical protein